MAHVSDQGFRDIRMRHISPHSPTLSVLSLILVMCLWGSTFVVTRAALREISPLLFAVLRFSVASLLLVALAWLRKPSHALPRPIPWATLSLMALMGVALYYVAFNVALLYTTASQGALVQSSIPAITAIMAMVQLRERVALQRLVGIALAVIGALLILSRARGDPSAPAPLLGNLLMFATVLVWGGYTVLAKRLAHVDPIALTASVAVLGTIILIPAALIEAAGRPVASISVTNWLRIVYLGVFPSALAYVLYNRAMRDLDASQVGVFINLIPVVGVALGVAVLGERVTPFALAGGVLVLIGIWISSRQQWVTLV